MVERLLLLRVGHMANGEGAGDGYSTLELIAVLWFGPFQE